MTNKASPLALGIAGANGRMGRALIEAAQNDAAVAVAFVFTENDDARVGERLVAGAPPLATAAELADAEIDVLIDFTAAAATMQFLSVCRRRGIGMVVGTTGFTAEQQAALRQGGDDIPLLVAQNMSTGVNALYDIAAAAAQRLQAGRLGGGYDMEVSEAHHRHKKDAPSGTALRLGRTLAQATGGDFDDDAVFTRHGGDGLARGAHDIGFSVVRGGDIVGEHRVLFAGDGEQLEIIHRSTSRLNYAAGAVRAAKFIAGAAPGYYDGMGAVSA